MSDSCALLVEPDQARAAVWELAAEVAGLSLAACADEARAILLCQTIEPALLVMDLDRPASEADGLRSALGEWGFDPPVLWYSRAITRDGLLRVRNAGDRGLVRCTAGLAELRQALEATLSGGTYFSSLPGEAGSTGRQVAPRPEPEELLPNLSSLVLGSEVDFDGT